MKQSFILAMIMLISLSVSSAGNAKEDTPLLQTRRVIGDINVECSPGTSETRYAMSLDQTNGPFILDLQFIRCVPRLQGEGPITMKRNYPGIPSEPSIRIFGTDLSDSFIREFVDLYRAAALANRRVVLEFGEALIDNNYILKPHMWCRLALK